MINGDFHLIDPIITLRLSSAGIAIQQFITRWEGALLTLPINWRELWLQPLTAWLAEVYVNKLTTNRNLIIDINPYFPFQITALDGYGSHLLLARNHQWGWGSALNLNGSEATFNKVDVRHPSLALNTDIGQINVTELSAIMVPQGLLGAEATVDKRPGKPFQLSLNGRAVPMNILQQWGWQPVPLTGDGNLQLRLKGLLNSEQPFKSSLQGTLMVTASDGQTVNQPLP